MKVCTLCIQRQVNFYSACTYYVKVCLAGKKLLLALLDVSVNLLPSQVALSLKSYTLIPLILCINP